MDELFQSFQANEENSTIQNEIKQLLDLLNNNVIVENIQKQFKHVPRKNKCKSFVVLQPIQHLDDDIWHEDTFSINKSPQHNLTNGKNKNVWTNENIKENELIKEVQGLIDQANYLLDERKLLQSKVKIDKIEQIISQNSQFQSLIKMKEDNTQLIELINEEVELIKYNLQVLENSDDGWILDTIKGKIKISYQFPDQQSMSIKMESEVDVPLKNILCLGNEFEYFKDYVPFVDQGRLVQDIRKATKIGYACMDVPMVSKRECYFLGAGYNLLDEIGSIILVSKSIHDDIEYCNKIGLVIPKNKNYVRLDYKFYVLNIIPLGPQKCFLKMIVNVDYKIPLVPKSIQNWCGRKFAMYFIENIIKKATNFKGSNWEKAIQKSQQFYDWIESVINSFLTECNLQDNSIDLQEARSRIKKYVIQKNIPY